MAKLVIYTQHLENYAEAGDRPYWKPKGGDVYVVGGLSEANVERINMNGFPNLRKLIESDSEYFIESVEMWDIKADDEEVCEPWETPISVTYNKMIGRWTAKRVTYNGEYGYMKAPILSKTETWDMEEGKRAEGSYRCSYTVDGYGVVSSDRIMKVLEEINEKSVA